MAWKLNAAEAAFKDEVRSFLDASLTPDLRTAGRRCSGIFTDYDDGIRWHRILASRGWSVPHWPVEHGGTGWTPMQHYIFASEMATANAPPLAPNATRMVAPVLIAFGTAEHKQRWLPGIREGADYWAQGYSEPQSGSDLASLQCRAVRDGDDYVINGTKIWTTHAQWANRMFCLVRTNSVGKPQQGISFLCFDLKVPGITVRPIISISGDHELNQVFFDDARVPVSSLIGEENQGWAIAKYLLQHERGGAWAPQLRARLRRIREAAHTAWPAAGGACVEADDMALRLAEMDCAIDAVEAMELQSLRAQVQGEPPGIRPSIGKVQGTELRQRLTEIALEIAGTYAAVDLPLAQCLEGEFPVPEEAAFAMSAYLNDRAASIYAGSNEVQRNIIAADLLRSNPGHSTRDDTLAMVCDSLARYLEGRYSFDQRQRALAEATHQPPAFWSGLSRELGLLGVALPEAQGGLGGGMAAHLAVMETLGGALAGEPYLSSIVIGAGLLQRHPGAFADALLADVVDGRAVLAFAHGEAQSRNDRAHVETRLVRDAEGYELNGSKAVVHAAPWATHLIVSARSDGEPTDGRGLSLVVIEKNTPGVHLREYALRDGTRGAEVRFDKVRVPIEALLGTEGGALPQIEQAIDEATLAVCAESIGVMRRLMHDTLDYVRQRKQFGVAISSFQALQHRLADMHMALEQANALTYAVLEAMGDEPLERACAISSAKVAVARACKAVGQGAVQLHGGMGMTEELAIGHYFRRATLIEGQFGPASWHLRRVARIQSAREAEAQAKHASAGAS